MKKILSVSVIAMLAVSPMMAFADPTCPGVDQGNCNSNVASSGPGANGYSLSQSATGDDTNVVTASYVKGAYNDAITKINKVAAEATAGITNAAGSGLVPNGSALDINLTTDGGLAITSDALNVVVDGSTVTKGTGGALQVGTITDSNVASNAAIEQSKIANLTTDLGNKQGKLANDDQTENANTTIGNTVKTTVAAAATASNNSLVTEKAVRDAIDSATGNATTGMVTVNGTQTLTNKTIDADDNTIADLELDNFKSGVVVDSTDGIAAVNSALDTAVPTEKAVATALAAKQNQLKSGSASGSDMDTVVKTTVATGGAGDATSATALVSESAVRDAITAATTTAGMVTTSGLAGGSSTGYDIDAKTLKVGSADVATQNGVDTAIGRSTITVSALTTWGQTSTGNITGITFTPGTYNVP